MQYDTDQHNDENVDLASFDGGFDETKAPSGGFEKLPDGMYQVNVDRVELAKTKSTNRPMIKWQLRILAPTHSGRMLWKNSVVTENALKWIKKDLITAGLILKKFSDLPSRLNELVNIQLEVKKTSSGNDDNVYLNKRIEIDVAAASGSGVSGGTGGVDELAPF